MKETELSEEVARREGGAKSIDIAQIKEIQRNLLDVICNMDNDEIKDMITHHRELMASRV